ncbi:MAG: deferrochelatase/peroxidase EfeB [Castellaniella sp.]|uniref:iron uptake transporter deferrochelatase/peroxidase subunit n=1 Tax=Castellaniella sp. TaxID=1955812 RepID=UPI0012127285|nr:iron uptake transporter deferrochelatase/peroxidase subunit [Castellaniella sp.]TAN28379.1 MAG: deferrochelatase/peroxidase EfeB [Castellaniella sp.]
MNPHDDKAPRHPARRHFLKAGGAAAIAAGTLGTGAARAREMAATMNRGVEPFYGRHQGGIITPQQSHAYVAALDLTTAKREDIVALLKTWTEMAARLTRGEPAGTLREPADKPALDSGEALDLGASSLTLTFGFGPGMFTQEGKDRYGLARYRPPQLVDLPRFNGEQLIAAKTGGDLFIQGCADNAQVVFHAVRQLIRTADGTARVRWGQAGFLSTPKGETPRNLMGFKDGTINPAIHDPAAMKQFVWAGEESPAWMRGGTYTVVRRIRITLEHWDQMERGFQESVFGRHKYSGAPLGGKHEMDPLDLKAVDKDGNPIIPENAHARLSNQAMNNGAQILRRSYSYNESTDFYIERWPPWRQETEYDAGLIFIAHQRDPRKGFIPINDRLSKFDMLNQFVTHVGSAIFACPSGIAPGQYIGQGLFKNLDV